MKDRIERLCELANADRHYYFLPPGVKLSKLDGGVGRDKDLAVREGKFIDLNESLPLLGGKGKMRISDREWWIRDRDNRDRLAGRGKYEPPPSADKLALRAEIAKRQAEIMSVHIAGVELNPDLRLQGEGKYSSDYRPKRVATK